MTNRRFIGTTRRFLFTIRPFRPWGRPPPTGKPQGQDDIEGHPIYTGLVLLLAGYTLAWSNWTLSLILGFISRQYFQAKAGAEERWLLDRFPGYKSYMRRVPRRVL